MNTITISLKFSAKPTIETSYLSDLLIDRLSIQVPL